MKTASLELSRKLHDLSGWGDTEKVYAITDKLTFVCDRDEEDPKMWPEYPAYDTDYLLHKLPPGLSGDGMLVVYLLTLVNHGLQRLN